MRTSPIGWLAVLVVLAGSAVQAEDGPSSLSGESKRALFRARQLISDGRPAEGAGILESHLRDHPEEDNYLVRSTLGACLIEADRPQEALTHLEKAVGLNPGHAPGWIALGNLHYELRRYTKAGEAFESGYRTSPRKEPAVLYYAGVAFLLGDRPGKSFELLRELLTAWDDTLAVDWYRAFAAAAAEADRQKECWPVLRNLVTQAPNNLDAWRLLFQAAGSMQDYRRALVTLAIVDYMKPLRAGEVARLGDLYLEAGIPLKAAACYVRALEDSSVAEWRERLASSYIEAHESKLALEYLSRATREHPSPRLWSLLGDLHYQSGRYEESLKALAEAASLGGDRGRLFLMRGYCAYELGRPGEAREYLTEALKFPETREPAQRAMASLDRLPSP